MEPAVVPVVHEHIGRVKLVGQPGDFTRAQIVQAIKNGDRFSTNANPPAVVIVHQCPQCKTWDYITTAPDYTPTNNLLSLPRY
jgi:hypothetical protein